MRGVPCRRASVVGGSTIAFRCSVAAVTVHGVAVVELRGGAAGRVDPTAAVLVIVIVAFVVFVFGFWVVIVVVIVIVIVIVPMPVAVRPTTTVAVRTPFGLERRGRFGHVQMHRRQHLGEHRIGFDLQVVGPHFDRDVAVAEVVRRPCEVARRAMGGAGAHDEHRLCGGVHAHQAAVVNDEQVAAANDAAARQENGDAAAAAVGQLEAAAAADIPRQFDRRRAALQRRRDATAAGNALVGCQHGGRLSIAPDATLA